MPETITFKVTLLEPKIPQNTGNIARMCLAARCRLELVGKLGFLLSDQKLKRAGLDYWPKVDAVCFDDLTTYIAELKASDRNSHPFAIFSTKGKRPYYDYDFPSQARLIFGSEDKGFPKGFLDDFAGAVYTIPMLNPEVRSLNLSASVAIVLFEGLRQLARASERVDGR